MMNQTIRCPKCDQPPAQVGQFWICPQHGQVSLEKPFAPLRIFLSYGHDASEELVRRIKADLEKRGHDVWFDKNEIKGGHDWRRSITEGIVRTLAFQIATRLPDYRKLLLTLPEITELDRKNPAELFDYLLADPLRHAIDGGQLQH